jgi:hypothetical protein
MDNTKERQRMYDRKYREKMKSDHKEEYDERRRQISHKSYASRKSTETPRDARQKRKKHREAQARYREKKKTILTVENIHQQQDNSIIADFSTPCHLSMSTQTSVMSSAATKREQKKIKSRLVKLGKENVFLKRKVWRLSKRLSRRQNQVNYFS